MTAAEVFVSQVPGLIPGTVVVSRTGPAVPVASAPSVVPEAWECHRQRLGPRPAGGPWLLDAATELLGCGGGFFPAARKWRAALAEGGPVTVVANAAESEPLSAKDATLLRLRPHLVLDGLATLAETLDASAAVIWMHDTDPGVRESVVRAVHQRRGRDEVRVRVRSVHGGYLAGESSAIKRVLEGGPVAPQFHGFRSRAKGPAVVVQNVETLARLAPLGRRGLLRPAAVPSRLLTVLTPTDRRVVEVPDTTTLGDAVALVAGLSGGDPAPPDSSAVLMGGFGGLWARWSDVADLPVAEAAFRERGLTLGAGIVAPLWRDGCGVALTAAVVAYLARESARQCGPCLFGLPALADSLARLRDGTARRRELTRVRGDLALVAGRGACHHPDGAVRLVRSALEVFGDDIAAHAAGSPCRRSGDAIPVPS